MKDNFKVDFVCKDVIYTSLDENYMILSVKNVVFEEPFYSKDIKDLIVKGYFDSKTGRGTCLSGVCEWSFNDKYGWQLYCKSSIITLPSSKSGIVSFLTKFCKGVGSSLAKKIVEVYKEDTLNKIKESEDCLSCIKGIGKVKAQKIRTSVLEHSYVESLAKYLCDAGINDFNDISLIYKALGNNAIQVISENPYVLCDIIQNGLLIADRMVVALGIQTDPIERLSNILYYYIKTTTSFGDMCIERDCLYGLFGAFLDKIGITDIPCDQKLLYEALSRLEKQSKVRYYYAEGVAYIYDDKNYTLEDYSAYELSKMILDKSLNNYNNDRLNKFFDDFEYTNALFLNNEQKKAVKNAVSNKFSIITGGAGVGKTVTITALISFLESQNKTYVLAAPTGRAAKRITEVTGKEAFTLHRLLYIPKNMDDNDFDLVSEIDTDYILCDEASMIDAKMFEILVTCCVNNNISLVLIGDDNQLPPVGKGFVFKELVKLDNLITVTHLTTLYRQEENSQINGNARKVLNGDNNLSFVLDNQDFYFLKTKHLEQTKQIICKSIESLTALGIPLDDITVLSPMSKGPLGCVELNKYIQNNLPIEDRTVSFANKQYRFFINDRVMQTVNNYSLVGTNIDTGEHNFGVFNGDIGIIESIDLEENVFTVLYDNGSLGVYRVRYDIDDMADDIALAYALTVHKAQGCEFACVILPYDKMYTNVNRFMIYTSITRAKKRVIMIGEPDALYKGINNVTGSNKLTNLGHMVTSFVNDI